MDNVFYHVTKKESVDNILKYGLIPLIGDRSQMANESERRIYLSKKEDVGYWKNTLVRDAVFKIDASYINEDMLTSCKYYLYTEYMYTDNIPPEALELVEDEATEGILISEEQMKKLCISSLFDINDICQKFSMYVSVYDAPVGKELLDEISFLIKYQHDVFDNLDFSKMPVSIIKEKLKNISKCKTWPLMGDKRYCSKETLWLYQWILNTFDIDGESEEIDDIFEL